MIAPPLQTHPEMEAITMEVRNFFPDVMTSRSANVVYYVNNTTDYWIALSSWAVLEVFSEGYWRRVPFTGYTGIRVIFFDSQNTIDPHERRRYIKDLTEHRPLTPGLYRIRKSIYQMSRYAPFRPPLHPGQTLPFPIPPERTWHMINHELAVEFYLEYGF